MTRKLNCWEFKNCGREENGLMVPLLGECPVPKMMKFDGMNEGIGGGRACWMAGKSICSSKESGCPNLRNCHRCDFYRRVVFEQEDKSHFRFTSIEI